MVLNALADAVLQAKITNSHHGQIVLLHIPKYIHILCQMISSHKVRGHYLPNTNNRIAAK